MDGLHIMNKCIKDLNRHNNRFHHFQRFFTFLNEGEWEKGLPIPFFISNSIFFTGIQKLRSLVFYLVSKKGKITKDKHTHSRTPLPVVFYLIFCKMYTGYGQSRTPLPVVSYFGLLLDVFCFCQSRTPLPVVSYFDFLLCILVSFKVGHHYQWCPTFICCSMHSCFCQSRTPLPVVSYLIFR